MQPSGRSEAADAEKRKQVLFQKLSDGRRIPQGNPRIFRTQSGKKALDADEAESSKTDQDKDQKDARMGVNGKSWM